MNMKTFKALSFAVLFILTQLTGSAQPCAISCTSNMLIKADKGQEGAIVNIIPASIAGECGRVTYFPASGTFFRLGSHSVTATTAEIQQEAMYSLMDQFRKYGMTDMSAFGDMKEIVSNYLRAEDGKNFRETQQAVVNKKLALIFAGSIKIEETDVTVEQFSDAVKEYTEKQK